jgi:hypothetical protein
MTMAEPMDATWVAKRVNEAAKASPVSDTVVTAIEDELNGTMRERALRPGELTELAKRLLAAVSVPSLRGPAT